MMYFFERSNQNDPDAIQIYSGGHLFTSRYYDHKEFTQLVSPGDVICLGRHYLESETFDADIIAPLQWIVMEKHGDRLLLLSRYQIELMLADNGDYPLKYGDSYIRRHLRESLHAWFRDWELALIEDTHLGETKNPVYDTADDPDVYDKLFLPAVEEVLKFFDPKAYAQTESLSDKTVFDDRRRCYYPMCDTSADTSVVIVDDPPEGWTKKTVRPLLELLVVDFVGWWTRTPGSGEGYVVAYESGGKLNLSGLSADSDEVGIRPALWLDMKKILK